MGFPLRGVLCGADRLRARTCGPTRRSGPARPWPAAALLASLALLAAACAESAPTADTRELGPAQQVQQLLDTRADALADGDVDGCLASLDAPAREVEEPIAVQAARMPLSEVRLRLRDPTFSRREVGGEQVTVADNTKVDFVFAYEGIPQDNRFRFRLRYDLEERGDGWAGTDAEVVIPDEQTPVPMPPMWALGPTEVARSEHFLALHRPGLDDPNGVLALAEQARARLMPKPSLEADAAHVLQGAATGEEYARIISPAAPPRSVAVASSVPAGARYASSRVPQNRHMTVDLEAIFAGQLPPEAVGHGGAARAGDADPAGRGGRPRVRTRDHPDRGLPARARPPRAQPVHPLEHSRLGGRGRRDGARRRAAHAVVAPGPG